MTMEDLIKKLMTEKSCNGGWGLLSDWFGELKEMRVKVAESRGTKEWSRFRESQNASYHQISGFIWGLYVAGYISDAERNALTNELLEAAHEPWKGENNEKI